MTASTPSQLLKHKTIDAIKAVRKKFADFKRNKAQSQLTYHTTHKQIIKPLGEIETTLKAAAVAAAKNQNVVNDNEKEETNEEEEEAHVKYEVDDDDDEWEDEEKNEELFQEYHVLPQYYARLLSDKNVQNVDRSRYALHFDIRTNRWKMGNSNVTILGKDIEVGGSRYNGTAGLYNLLTLKDRSPDISRQDIGNYRNIVLGTNANRAKYTPTGRIVPSSNWKYQDLIRGYSDRKKSGRSGTGAVRPSLKSLNSNRIEYVYWNTPSELVQRLRLLYAANASGNNSSKNINEIVSIITELKEEGIIS